jgi:hypothetical protein
LVKGRQCRLEACATREEPTLKLGERATEPSVVSAIIGILNPSARKF